LDFVGDSQGYLQFNLAEVADARGLNVDACFRWNDECCNCGFRFSEFAFGWEKAFPFGFNFDSVGFVFVVDDSLFGEEL